MSSTAVLSSASGILSLLDESDPSLQIHALNQLNTIVDKYWPEIATVIPKIEILYENESFNNRGLAAIVTSKVYYHLEELDEALKYALGAGELFDVNNKSEYVQTLISKCIDEYIRLRVLQTETKRKPTTENEEENSDVKMKENEEIKIDTRLVNVVERMFERCFTDGLYRQGKCTV